MTMTINGSGTITGLTAGGLPSATVTQSTLAIPTAGTGPAFSAVTSSTQTVSASTWTKLTPQIEQFDTNNNYDNSTNYRFTPTVAGYYQINGSASIAGATNSWAKCAIYKNGSVYKNGTMSNANAFSTGNSASVLVYCNGSTDYVELYVIHNYGAPATLDYGTASCYFQGSMVRAA